MSTLDIIRAWKDEEYRLSLDETLLPAHPAGLVELTDADLEQVAGGHHDDWYHDDWYHDDWHHDDWHHDDWYHRHHHGW
jgi:mersacidin/lichenicidin family type 2 lantibiotic